MNTARKLRQEYEFIVAVAERAREAARAARKEARKVDTEFAMETVRGLWAEARSLEATASNAEVVWRNALAREEAPLCVCGEVKWADEEFCPECKLAWEDLYG